MVLSRFPKMLNTLAALPSELLYKVTEELNPKSLLNMIQTCSKIRLAFEKEYFWRLRCCRDFPWFFWHGHCETDQLPPTLRVPNVNTVPVLGLDDSPPCSPEVTLSRTEMFGDESSCTSLDCKVKMDNPYHKLPDSSRKAYFLLVSGKYSGILQVIDSLQNRQLSAYTAIATFDLKSESFLVSYSNSFIGMYRRGIMVTFEIEEGRHDDQIFLNDIGKLRRIPASMVAYSPRENYSRDLFNLPVSVDGRPLFYFGEEVEIQWKHMQNAAFAWWRAIVVQCYLDPRFAVSTESTTELSNLPFLEGTEQGILVMFPQYPIGSVWRYVVVSLFGNELENARGFAGGIRKITCKVHADLWTYRWPLALESMEMTLNAL